MRLDEAVALSLIPDLSRVGLGDRLRGDDPVLLEEARRLHDRAHAVRERAEAAGLRPCRDCRPDLHPISR